MENRIKKKIALYLNTFKDDIIKEISNKFKSDNNVSQNDSLQQVINYINGYSRLSFNEEDFSKRKRVKNHIPEYDRCCAKRADGTQCTRRKKSDDKYCGTHLKGIPHGEIMCMDINEKTKIELLIKTVDGIPQYVDGTGKIYKAEEVLKASVAI
jgi:hypothetical protein